MPRWLNPHVIGLAGSLCLVVNLTGAPLRVGVETDLEPFTFMDQSDQPAGFAIDLINAVAHEMKLEVEFVMRPRSAMFQDFSAGRLDALANVVYLKEREPHMAFATSYLELRSTVFMRKGDKPINALQDLRDRRLAGIPNTRGYEYLRVHGLERNFVPVATQREAMHAVATGKADATVGTRLIGLKLIRDDELVEIEASDVELSDLSYRYHIVLHPGDAARLALINEGLARVREDGTYQKLREKWIGPYEPHRLQFRDLRPYLVATALLLGAALIAFLWQRRLLKRLASQAEALRESGERLTLVLEGSQDGFWDCDFRTGRIARSERWASMLGYSLAEIEATIDGGRKLVHPDDVALYYDAPEADRPSRVNDHYAVEYRMRSKSGEWRWILDRGKVVSRAPDGTRLRMAGTHTDITERKRTEAALRESERLLQRSAHLLEQTQSAAHVGGWEVDLRTERLFWTEETYRIHETTAQEFHLTLATALDFFTPESRPAINAALEQARSHGTPFELESDLLTAKQRPINVQVIGRAEREGGQVVKIYGSFRDITDQRTAATEQENLQIKMVEAQKLESLGVLAGGIAHDFNNLLTVILANASLTRHAPPAPGDTDERLLHIEHAAQRAADLCRQMLAYAGKGNFVVERINLSTLVKDTAGLLAISIGKKSHLELALADDLPAIDGDPSQLRQVVMNLLINAAEALGDSSGEIRLTTRRCRAERCTTGVTHWFDLPAGDCVCLEVSDTGCGMSPTTLARIYDPFYTTKFAGRGLGLAAVLGIVRVHRGALNVQSTAGRGSLFTLYLPSAVSALAPPPVVSKEQKRTAAPDDTILIADDEPTVLATMSTVLRHHGYTTVLARDGFEAVERFTANPHGFIVVLLDLTMPGLNGAEVLRAIRAINPSARVLLMSGYSERDVLDRLQGQENVAILRKPFTQETLVKRVSEVIAQAPKAAGS